MVFAYQAFLCYRPLTILVSRRAALIGFGNEPIEKSLYPYRKSTLSLKNPELRRLRGHLKLQTTLTKITKENRVL